MTSFIPDELHLVLCGRVALKFVDAQELVSGLSKSVRPYTEVQWATKEWGLLQRLKWDLRSFCNKVAPPRVGDLKENEGVETVAVNGVAFSKSRQKDKQLSVTVTPMEEKITCGIITPVAKLTEGTIFELEMDME